MRTLWHLVLLSLIAALFVGAARYFSFSAPANKLAEEFESQFGRIAFVRGSVLPSIAPGVAKSMNLPPNGRLLYQPEWRLPEVFSARDLELFRYLVVWSPRRAAMAVNYGGDVGWYANIWELTEQGNSTVERLKFDNRILRNSAELAAMFENAAPSSPPPQTIPRHDREYSVQELLTPFLFAVAGTLAFFQFLECLILSALYFGMFALVFKLTGGARRLRVLSFGEFCRIGIYAGFPAMLVAACFPAFELPFFSFSSIYMIGTVFYWLFAAGRIERRAAGTPEQ